MNNDKNSGQKEDIRKIINKILIVDDDEDLCSLYNDLLTHAGYTVFVARNGEDGVKINRKEDPDFILLDLKMPGIDGIETLRRIRKEDPSVIVIIVSGHADAQAMRDSADLNVYKYISKPFNIVTVIRATEDAVASKKIDKI